MNSMKRFLGRVFISSTTLICMALVVVGQGSGLKSNNSSFPLSTGNYWVYQGTVRWTQQNSSKTSETRVTWKTEIRRILPHRDFLGAVVTGWPADLDWSDGHPAPADSLLIRSPEAKFYLITQQQFGVALKRLEDSNDSLQDLFSADDLFLDLPLEKGKKFCDADGMTRTDGHYCWVVGQPKAVSLDNVKGVQPSRRIAYPVAYLTNPDDSEFEFVPGVGLTSYSYHHHGTVADTELRLVEVHLGGDP
jgi:hypothetical protein